jgi:hypothetical protein
VSCEEKVLGSGDNIRYGKVRKRINVRYTLTTTEDTYIVFMLDYYKDTINPDNQGLYSLRVYREADAATQGGSWQDIDIPGVYRPEGQQ